MKMDSKDYKEIIAADPSAPIDVSGLDADQVAEAEAFRAEMRALDDRISKALAIDVPELRMPELPDVGEDLGGDDGNVVNMPVGNKRHFSTPAWLGIAASIALVAVFAGRIFTGAESYDSLADEVIAHLDHEPVALTVTSTPVAERRLLNVVSRSGVEIETDVGLVTYAKSCVINGKTVPHLVIQGKLGPITLLLMPDEKVDNAVPLTGESINGVILPVGDGSIAIIGEREENLNEIEKRVVDSVTWTI